MYEMNCFRLGKIVGSSGARVISWHLLSLLLLYVAATDWFDACIVVKIGSSFCQWG